MILTRPNYDLGQWRIKVEVMVIMSCHVMSCHVMSCHVITCHYDDVQIDFLDLDCDSGLLQLVEDGETKQNLKICNGRR